MFHLFRSEPSPRSHPALTNDLVHPPDVARRHAAVQKLRLLDTTPEERFDRCTRLLAASLHAPIALLTLMDAEREWLKSTHGWSTVRELSLHDSIGIHILGQDSHSFVVQDATKDTRFAGHPLVKGPEKIRFIAGQALSDVDGVKVGALYILDRQRRTLTAAEAQILADVALLAGQELRGLPLRVTLEQQQIKQRLHESLALQSAILDSAHVAIVSTERDGTIRSFNAAAERMFGHRAADLIGKQKPDIWHDLEELRQIAQSISEETGQPVEATGEVLLWKLRSGGVAEHEMTCVRADGSTFRGLHAITALRGTDGEISGYMGVIQDVTARHEVERAQQAARDEAEAANHAKSQFVANMSHEVRTPLNGILGVTAMLLETELLPEQRQLAEIVRSSAESLLAIVNDVLDFSKVEAGRIELEMIDFDLLDTLQSVVDLQATRACEKCLAIKTNIPAETPVRVHGDPLRLRQVLNNLVGNAIKFSERGSIRLAVQVEEISDDEVALRFHVRDSGVGIPPEKQTQIFEPFAQADLSTTRVFGGTGLGLSICRQLVELMGGQIGVESTPGEGADFWFTARFGWPVDVAEAFASAREEKPLPHLRVLLAEDSAINRLVATHQLSKLGCEVDAVTNGREAVTASATVKFDLILMDCQMPEMDGYTATAVIRERDAQVGSHTRIIALTANAMTGERERCLEAGMDGYLSKPFRPAELHQLIADVVRRTHSFVPKRRGEAGALDAGTIADLLSECEASEGETFRQYVDFFCEDAAQAEEEFLQARENLEIYRTTAHRLRGAAANFGATPLMDLCECIERHAVDGNLAEITALLPALQAEVSRVVIALREEEMAAIGC